MSGCQRAAPRFLGPAEKIICPHQLGFFGGDTICHKMTNKGKAWTQFSWWTNRQKRGKRNKIVKSHFAKKEDKIKKNWILGEVTTVALEQINSFLFVTHQQCLIKQWHCHTARHYPIVLAQDFFLRIDWNLFFIFSSKLNKLSWPE